MNLYLLRPILVYAVCPIILLALFGWKKPRLAPLALVICPVIEFIVYHQEFFYYESRGLILLITAIQVILTAIPAFIIQAKSKARRTSR